MHRRRHGHRHDHRADLTGNADVPGGDRLARLLGDVDLGSSKGLELGPLTNPVVPRSRGDIRYLDHVDTAALRARYATHVGFDVDAIVEIDYASAGRPISATVGADAPFDYVIASHVIEHVPDLVGWLADLRRVVADDGFVALAVPDQRRCFDAVRQPTCVADVVDAHLRGAAWPSARQVFDHHFSAASWRGGIAWEADVPIDELHPVHPLAEAMEVAAEVAATGEYHDVHCWVFTPRSFCRLFTGLQRLGLVPFDVVTCSEPVGMEFYVRLRPADPAAASTSIVVGGPERASEAAVGRAELEVAERALDAARRRIAAIESSRSWRVTRPLRAVNERRARRR